MLCSELHVKCISTPCSAICMQYACIVYMYLSLYTAPFRVTKTNRLLNLHKLSKESQLYM